MKKASMKNAIFILLAGALAIAWWSLRRPNCASFSEEIGRRGFLSDCVGVIWTAWPETSAVNEAELREMIVLMNTEERAQITWDVDPDDSGVQVILLVREEDLRSDAISRVVFIDRALDAGCVVQRRGHQAADMADVATSIEDGSLRAFCGLNPVPPESSIRD
jgi:hypothetical protein